MDNYIFSEYIDHQKLIAIVALLLAAKSEDLDELIPSIKDILELVDISNDLGVDLRFKNELKPEEISLAYKSFASMYCRLEYLIFEVMQFNTIRPSFVSFLNIFQNIVVLPGDDQLVSLTIVELRVSAKKLIQEFMEVIMHDIDFMNIRPSELAAAVIASSRKLLKIKGYWNNELAEFTRYKIDAIRPLILVLLEKRVNFLYRERIAESYDVVMKDSGYISPASVSETDDEVKPRVKRRRVTQRVPITFGVI